MYAKSDGSVQGMMTLNKSHALQQHVLDDCRTRGCIVTCCWTKQLSRLRSTLRTSRVVELTIDAL